MDISVSADSVGELSTKHRTRPKIISWKYLDIFIEDSMLDSSPARKDYKEKLEIEDSKLFYYQCFINDIPYEIILTMRKAVDDIDKL